MLNEIDEALVGLFRKELPKIRGREAYELKIGEPPKEVTEILTLNLFLHDVVENAAMRDQSFEVRPTADYWTVEKARRATRLDVSYLLTAHGGDASDQHRLLGQALQILLKYGYVPPEFLSESLLPYGDEAVLLSVGQRDNRAHLDANSLWLATGLPLRPALALVATAMLDPFESKTVRVVREAVIGLARSVNSAGPERQMDLRSLRVVAAGRVVDDRTDAPVTNAFLSIDGESKTPLTRKGVFLARDIPPGSHSLQITAEGYEDWIHNFEASPPLRGETMEPLEVRLHPIKAAPTKLLRMEGTLKFDDGRAAAYIPVQLGSRTVVTDANGRYVFDIESDQVLEVLAPLPIKVN